MKIIAIVPARSSSKGIQMKNIQKIAGKSLIEYAITSAKKSKLINKIIVTTDDEKIAQTANSVGAESPFLRPQKLSKDSSSSVDVIKHALQFLNINYSYVPDIIVLLQPTSPFRTTEMIDKSIIMLRRSKASSILSVSKIKTHPYLSFWYKKNYLKPFKSDFVKYNRRQTFPLLYYPTGDIFTFWYSTLKEYNSIYGPKIKPLIINDIAIDIDEPFDLFISEMKMLYWKKYKKRFD